MSDNIFENIDAFRQTFIDKLAVLLDDAQLGSFILVLANAVYDPSIYRLLQSRLEQRFTEISAGLRQQLMEGQTLNQPEDDLLVFLKLMATGLNNLEQVQFRHAGPWELQYNHVRAFRPPRMSDAVVTELHTPFDPEDFHFNKPFLRKEILWEGELMGDHCRLLYNKFPFAPLHGLLVVEPDEKHPQYLGKFAHEHTWNLLLYLGEALPDCGLGYNARGAYSSVNHQHLQMYVGKTGGYPVEQACWQHNGGDQDYPLACKVFDTAAESWHFIDRLHQANQGYNLLYRPGRVHVIPRALQGSYRHADWTGGFAWAETAGAITLFNQALYCNLDENAIIEEMDKMTCP
jgi:hypothetical protein